MVRPALLVTFALILATGCSPSGPAATLQDASEATSTVALETAAVRQAVLDFLEAYARSGEDIDPLRALVVGPELRDWVHWLAVQHRYLPATGELDVRGIRVLLFQDDLAVAAVDAVITFTFMSEDGQPIVSPRTIHSRAILARVEGLERWGVLDFVRDGRSMTDTITVLEPAMGLRHDGVVVEAVSVYRFSSVTAVNVRLRNTTSHPVRIDRERSALRVDGQTFAVGASTPTLAGTLRPGRFVEGAISFPPVPLTAVPEALILGFHDDARRVVLPFPAQGFRQGE